MFKEYQPRYEPDKSVDALTQADEVVNKHVYEQMQTHNIALKGQVFEWVEGVTHNQKEIKPDDYHGKR